MVMNKKGNLLYGLGMAILAFIAATIFISPLKEVIADARGNAGLNCSLSNLTTGVASTCVLVDLYLPALIGAVIVLGFGYLGYKYIG